MKAKAYPPPDYFQGIFTYKNGDLFFRDDYARRHYAGRRAGRIQKAGYKEYRQVKVEGRSYYAHRVVWIMHNGPIPDGKQIDHINGCGVDNQIENLRLVDPVENNRNKRRTHRGSGSGYTGVTYDKHAGRWKAHIEVGGRHINLGHYPTPEEAYKARRLADEKYGFDVSHGVFAL